MEWWGHCVCCHLSAFLCVPCVLGGLILRILTAEDAEDAEDTPRGNPCK